ncbi:MAG: exodeoxyribonuclease VII small subunit [Candidatus Omnitrophica bacterium]|nr:exodeoxyribonuclease VII small subunit [Candidatus Omnitrophota bacterium]
MAGKEKGKEKELKFEDGLKRLEEIVAKLESGNLSLDDSLKLFEEGVKLVRFCNERLAEAQQKVELLTKDQAGNVIGSQLFDSENSENNN